jgi:hypothetical protein
MSTDTRAMAREKLEAPDHRIGLLLIWAGLMVIGAGMIAPINRTFELHYTFMLMVPVTCLLAVHFQALQRDLAKFERHVGSRTTVSLCCRQSGPF